MQVTTWATLSKYTIDSIMIWSRWGLTLEGSGEWWRGIWWSAMRGDTPLLIWLLLGVRRGGRGLQASQPDPLLYWYPGHPPPSQPPWAGLCALSVCWWGTGILPTSVWACCSSSLRHPLPGLAASCLPCWAATVSRLHWACIDSCPASACLTSPNSLPHTLLMISTSIITWERWSWRSWIFLSLWTQKSPSKWGGWPPLYLKYTVFCRLCMVGVQLETCSRFIIFLLPP